MAEKTEAAAAKAEAKAKEEAAAKANAEKELAEAKAKEEAAAKAKAKPSGFVVAKGCGVTCKKGILKPGDTITANMLGGGDDALASLKKSGIAVKG